MNTFTVLNLLLPRGSYSPSQPMLSSGLRAEANVFDGVGTSADAVKGAVTPYQAGALLSDWERVLGLTPSASTNFQQRQQRVLAKLSETGGLSIPYFVRLASGLGYSISIDEPRQFRAGMSRAGERLWDGDTIWVWMVNVNNSKTVAFRFRSGISTAGERLTSFGDPVIEEIFNELKPAHTFCYFAYQGNP
ncbi:YmfQ family protein [Citrobacter portucalensis]|uniref:YmfQ family protein n=1 Tax=Citrobacter portucalensis TaxID=1639133 RepID=UPI00226B1961|nr:YmfQ family protein [Citrobacter portucalensis]MCX9038755.1 YmfQ family protein [Citrobacter portucalensis]